MIHYRIQERVKAILEHQLITLIPTADAARVGVIKLGDLQGEPDPDIARISLTLYENDPDSFIGGAVTSTGKGWVDELFETEVGGVITMRRRFTVKGRCLLESSKEGLEAARQIASTVRQRTEDALHSINFGGINENGEYVSSPILVMPGEMLQAGGPPDSYDYLIKVRYEVLTTKS